MLFLALCTSSSSAKIPHVLHQYANGEDEIANILQLDPRRSAVDLPSIECEQRIGYDDGCSANFTNISVSRSSKSAGHTIAIECPLCAKTGSGPVLVGVGKEDGLGQTIENIIFHLASAWNHSFRFGGFLRHSVETVKKREPNFYKTLSTVLGFDYELLRPRVEPQQFGTCLHGCSGAKRIQEFSGTKPNDVLLDVVRTHVESALTPSFVHAWRAISGVFATPAKYFKQPGYHIAVHARRGDVTSGQKLIADDHIYINLARTVQARVVQSI